MYDEILIPTDGSDAAEAAIDQAIGQAAAFDARLHAVFVVELAAAAPLKITLDRVIDDLEEAGAAIVERVSEAASGSGVDVVRSVDHGVADEAIVDYVRDNDIDLVVIGTHGRRGLDRQLLGSVAERIVRSSPVPVLTVRMD